MTRLMIFLLVLTGTTSIWASDFRETPLTQLARGAEASPETMPVESDFLFDYLMQEVKLHYTEGRLLALEGDTGAVQFEFELMLANLAAIEELDSLGFDQRAYFTSLADLVRTDFLPYLDQERKNMLANLTFREQMIQLEIMQSVPDNDDDFIVLDDRDGHIPLVLNNRVRSIIKFLQTTRHSEFQVWMDRYAKYAAVIRPILIEHGVPEELVYLALIESGLNVNARSWAQAVGPWQFISSTGKIYGLERTWWIDERRDIVKSTEAAAKFLKKLYNEFDNWYLAMAAYNCGEGRVHRTIRLEGHRDFWRLRTLPKETRSYVPTVIAAAIIIRSPDQYGFTLPDKVMTEWEMVKVTRSIDLDRIARAAKIEYSILSTLNAELRQGVTPPDMHYALKVPNGYGDKVEAVINQLPTSDKEAFQIHYVRRGESLWLIARKYGVSVTSLTRANNLRNSNRLSVGQKLTIPLPGTTTYAAQSRSKQTLPTSSYNKLVYVVKRGDTLGHIAERYHTRASSIRRWNGLSYGEYIYPGQRLTIYQKKSDG
ncbi:MAG: LysM peptidoglycan-binding domain-containing protein [Candidatus Marinimicrobia bacterium]|nr:LysM peptidoglycan-binding domain-containing protein [Candidatus Neomarinimicrobiota bacterium]MCF7840675.1 LysM peptidoglycan-binding domain-containing protein [Candidatus Neomarinimicrobiota bacterium]MCF7903340.1 LysM peptidoglycan-binding domain-containing protein [Candidatus Neomarinimicrobiota bacterium]